MTEGLLQEVNLVELIQLLSLSDVTGVLELTPLYPPTSQSQHIPVGYLYFAQGWMDAAFLMDRSGAAAVANFLLWEAGFFRFRTLPRSELPPANIQIAPDSSQEGFLFSGIRRHQEWKEKRAALPSTRVTLVQMPMPLTPLPEHGTLARAIYDRCDGTIQFADIVAQLGLEGYGALGCREAAVELLNAQLLRQQPVTSGQKLVRIVVTTAYPTLGISAEVFCDDAMRAVGLPPETLHHETTIRKRTVGAMVDAMETAVAQMLGPQRAENLAGRLTQALGIPARFEREQEVHHV